MFDSSPTNDIWKFRISDDTELKRLIYIDKPFISGIDDLDFYEKEVYSEDTSLNEIYHDYCNRLILFVYSIQLEGINIFLEELKRTNPEVFI